MRTFWVFFLALCLCACCADLDGEKIRSELNQELHIGDSREKAEQVLKGRGIDFTYDGRQLRYQSSVRSKDKECKDGINIYVYIDITEKVSKIEMENFHSMP